MRGLWYSSGGESDSQVSPDLRTNGDLSLSGDALRLAGSAYVFRASPSPFGNDTLDPAARDVDSEIYKAFAFDAETWQIGSTDLAINLREYSVKEKT